MSVKLIPMTRELFHELWQGFEYDPATFMDSALYDKLKDYKYDPAKVNAHYDKRISDDSTLTFAIMLISSVIGEVVLKHIDFSAKQCELGIHLKNDSVKNKGYGTEAENLAIEYAFNVLGMDRILADSIVKNLRSQHILKKLGFRLLREENGFKFYMLEKE